MADNINTVSHVHEYLGNQHMFVEDYPTRALRNPGKWSLEGHSKAERIRDFFYTRKRFFSTRASPRDACPKLVNTNTFTRAHCVYVDGAHGHPLVCCIVFLSLYCSARLFMSEWPIPDMSDEEIYARPGLKCPTPGCLIRIRGKCMCYRPITIRKVWDMDSQR